MEERREMLAKRLQARNEERNAKFERKKEQRGATMASDEQVCQFLAGFRHLRSLIDGLLSRSKEEAVAGGLVAHFDGIEREIRAAEKMVSDAQIFLPAYDKQRANDVLASLKQLFFEQQSSLAEKKTFSFRSRQKNNMASGDELDGGSRPPVVVQRPEAEGGEQPVTSGCGLCNMSSQVLVKHANEVNGNDVVLHCLTNCTVRVFGNPSTVRVGRLSDCTVLLGPVSTSVFVSDCTRTTLAVACQQLRIHSALDCDFYVHVTSRSIIEDSRCLRFAPYAWNYDGVDHHYERSNLDRSVNNWRAVDDFNWLVMDVASPNWSILEDAQRVPLDDDAS